MNSGEKDAPHVKEVYSYKIKVWQINKTISWFSWTESSPNYINTDESDFFDYAMAMKTDSLQDPHTFRAWTLGVPEIPRLNLSLCMRKTYTPKHSLGHDEGEELLQYKVILE